MFKLQVIIIPPSGLNLGRVSAPEYTSDGQSFAGNHSNLHQMSTPMGNLINNGNNNNSLGVYSNSTPFFSNNNINSNNMNVKKFLHITKGSNDLKTVAGEINDRYQRLYPMESSLEIYQIQNHEYCDLDPDYTVEMVFDTNPICRVLIQNEFCDINADSSDASSHSKRKLIGDLNHLMRKKRQSMPIPRHSSIWETTLKEDENNESTDLSIVNTNLTLPMPVDDTNANDTIIHPLVKSDHLRMPSPIIAQGSPKRITSGMLTSQDQPDLSKILDEEENEEMEVDDLHPSVPSKEDVLRNKATSKTPQKRNVSIISNVPGLSTPLPRSKVTEKLTVEALNLEPNADKNSIEVTVQPEAIFNSKALEAEAVETETTESGTPESDVTITKATETNATETKADETKATETIANQTKAPIISIEPETPKVNKINGKPVPKPKIKLPTKKELLDHALALQNAYSNNARNAKESAGTESSAAKAIADLKRKVALQLDESLKNRDKKDSARRSIGADLNPSNILPHSVRTRSEEKKKGANTSNFKVKTDKVIPDPAIPIQNKRQSTRFNVSRGEGTSPTESLKTKQRDSASAQSIQTEKNTTTKSDLTDDKMEIDEPTIISIATPSAANSESSYSSSSNNSSDDSLSESSSDSSSEEDDEKIQDFDLKRRKPLVVSAPVTKQYNKRQSLPAKVVRITTPSLTPSKSSLAVSNTPVRKDLPVVEKANRRKTLPTLSTFVSNASDNFKKNEILKSTVKKIEQTEDSLSSSSSSSSNSSSGDSSSDNSDSDSDSDTDSYSDSDNNKISSKSNFANAKNIGNVIANKSGKKKKKNSGFAGLMKDVKK